MDWYQARHTYACHSGTQEGKAERSQVQEKPGLYREFETTLKALFQRKSKIMWLVLLGTSSGKLKLRKSQYLQFIQDQKGPNQQARWRKNSKWAFSNTRTRGWDVSTAVSSAICEIVLGHPTATCMSRLPAVAYKTIHHSDINCYCTD